MEIRLLGSLTVEIDGQQVALGGHKQQALLAFLAISAPHEVTADRCIDAVWGEDAPDGAGHSLQTYISNLRRELEPDHVKGESWSVIETTPAGSYRLNIPLEAMDVHRFQQVVSDAEQARPEDASRFFGEALELWGERPLGDLGDEPWARPFVSRVTELHVEVVAGHADARLELGHHEAVVGDLEAMIEAHPFKERFWGQLMLALYRSGRQAEALRTYGRLRTTLGEELGIDPSPELQSLEERILLQDPALAPPVRIPNNLPAAISSFVGRTADLAQVSALLENSRLVTITGAPGAGKTRLAYKVAESILEEFPDGVWSVELAPLRNGDLIVTELLSRLSLDTPVSKAPLDALCDQVSGWKALLVVDNCEHLLTDAARIVNGVLRASSDLKVLTTSRRALGIAGEVAWRLPPLGVPPSGTDVELMASDSTRLFVERAGAAAPGLDLTQHAGEVVEICRRLDGLPLAIELAAVRLRSMDIGDLVSRLGDRFRLLSQGDPTDDAHHRTLRAMVDWSYDLLDVKEQECYRRLAVFRGGWSPPAAEAVVTSKQIDTAEVLELVDSLVSNSLAVRSSRGREQRHTMLETLRDHGADLLGGSGERVEARDVHLSWVHSFAAEAGPAVDGREQEQWLAALSAELDNLRAAFDWGLSGGDPVVALDAASRITRYWWLASEIAEGADWIERLLDAAHEAPAIVRARGLSGSGFLINMLGQPERAEARLREAVAIFREQQDDIGLAWALNFLLRAAWDTDDTATLRSYQQEARALFAKHGDGGGIFTTSVLGMLIVSFLDKDRQKAVQLSHQLVAMAEKGRAPNALAHAYESLTWSATTPAEAREALSAYRKALPHYRQLGNRDCASHCLSGVAYALALQERLPEAAELLGAVEALLESLSVVPPGYERYPHDRAVAAVGEAELEAQARGRALDYEEAIDRALEFIG